VIAGTATPLEIVWTACTIAGLMVNSWGLLDAIADRSWLRDSGLNGRRELVARWHVMLNLALTYIQAAFLAGGVLALTSPEAATSGQRNARTAIQLIFLTVEPVLVALAIEARRYRGRLLATRRLTLARGAAADLDDDDAESRDSGA
jgi:hypothetical protein